MIKLKDFILEQAKPFRRHFITLVILTIFWSIDLSFRPYLIKMMLDRLSTTSPHDIITALTPLALFYVGMSVLMAIIFRVWNLIRRNFIPPLKGQITANMMAHMVRHSHHYYQNNFAGSLANKINDVAYGVAEIIEISLNAFIANGFALIIAAIVLATVRPMVCFIFVIWAFSFLIGSWYFASKAHYLSDRSSELRSQLTGRIVDTLGNMSAVRFFAGQQFELQHLGQWIKRMVAKERAFDWVLVKMFAFQALSFVIMQGITLFYLIHARAHASITVGDFALILSINIYIVDNLWSVGQQFTTFSEQLGKVSQGLRITLNAPDIDDAPNAQDLQATQGEIRFDQVDFGYAKQQPLFKNLSLHIRAGEKVGLVGYSGGGKTTLVNLILRLFDIQSGRVLIDGQNIAEVTQDSLRRSISMIPQDPTLFHRSLLDNIRYGNENTSFEAVQEAAIKGHADDFIQQLPEGYDSAVGERGIKLSGGQRQRIAITRAILKNAPILILDEATSSLDSLTERLIQDSLLKLMENKTTLVIAHRLSTLLTMDRILVFDHGRIIEQGSHETLLKQNGLYAKLWRSQCGGFLADETDV